MAIASRKKVDLEFVGGKDYVCPICCDVAYKSPQELGCCKAIFCKKCIEKLIISQVKDQVLRCPMCREKWTGPKDVARDVKREIDCLKVYCPNKNEGCSETFELKAAAEHIFKECLLQHVKCPCGTDVKRRDSEDHKQHHCPLRIVSCPVCQVLVSFHKLDLHKNTECRKVRVSCTNNECTVTVQRGKMSSHFRRCPYRIVDCSECGKSLKYKAFSDHATSTCPKRIVTCSWCNLKGKSELINGSRHRDIDCPFIPCPNGCEEGRMKRDLSDKHLDICPKQVVQCKYVGICNKTMTRDEEAIHYLLEMENHLRKSYLKFRDDQKKIDSLAKKVHEKDSETSDMIQRMTDVLAKLSSVMSVSEKSIADHCKAIVSAKKTMDQDMEAFSRKLKCVVNDFSTRHDKLEKRQDKLRQEWENFQVTMNDVKFQLEQDSRRILAYELNKQSQKLKAEYWRIYERHQKPHLHMYPEAGDMPIKVDDSTVVFGFILLIILIVIVAIVIKNF